MLNTQLLHKDLSRIRISIYCWQLISFLLVDKYGVVGASMAYAANYFLYWIVMIVFITKEIRAMDIKST